MLTWLFLNHVSQKVARKLEIHTVKDELLL